MLGTKLHSKEEEILNQNFYTTKEIVEKTGFSKDTLRYYEKIGVISNISRDKNNYRQYTEQNLNWLLLVKYLKKLDISTNQISGLQNLTIKESEKYIKQYQREIKNKIQELYEIDEKLTAKLKALKQGKFDMMDPNK
ncbi:MerR family transcriptional regulator [Staphylococcus xylosus]|nr:MerR family transcriptional regulator [Staphylococcus xylosus]